MSKMSEPFGRCGDMEYGDLQSIPDSRIENEGALSTQVGGSHYTECGIQPAEYAMANSFNYWQCLALRYMTRYKSKNGKQDLDKAIDCLLKLREHEYGND